MVDSSRMSQGQPVDGERRHTGGQFTWLCSRLSRAVLHLKSGGCKSQMSPPYSLTFKEQKQASVDRKERVDCRGTGKLSSGFCAVIESLGSTSLSTP